MAFLRRFADKTGIVDHQGRLPSPKVPVKARVLDTVTSSAHFQSVQDIHSLKYSPPRTKGTHQKSLSDLTSFQPYTITDYRLTQVHRTVELGGLGSNIGSQGWLKRKLRCDRQRTYAEQVKVTNANRLAFSQARLKPRSPERKHLVGTGKAALSRSCDISRTGPDQAQLTAFVQSLRAQLLA